MATRAEVDRMVERLSIALNQGKRAMEHLGWAHSDVRWEETLASLAALARASVVEPSDGIAPDYADSAE